LGTHYDALQFYQYEPCIAALSGRVRLVQVFRVRDANSLEEMEEALRHFHPDALMLDTYHPQHLGGAGATFDWSVAAEARTRFGLPLILAGGLTPENVGDAIRQVRPYAVDVSSGVEAEPGRKDFAKVRAFLAQVRLADAL
jgi:phosphoribosylanthranilate isomerase